MRSERSIKTPIYNSTIEFSDLISFTSRMEQLEKDYDIKVRIRVDLDDGVDYSYGTAAEALDKSNKHNIHSISIYKVLRISYKCYDHATVTLNSDHDSDFSVVANSPIGQVIKQSAVETLNLKTESKLIGFTSKSRVIPFLSALAFYAAYNDSGISLIIVFVSSFTLATAEFYSRRVKFKMGNSRDSFLTKNKDSIIITTVFSFAFYLLGLFTESILKFLGI